MSSGGESIGQHLDATGDREVVYCHQCEHEWYRDQGGLVCPRCDGEATEIVSTLGYMSNLQSARLHTNHPSRRLLRKMTLGLI
jgi:Zn finger protein HypA/HybF involved in hydrogenase expression